MAARLSSSAPLSSHRRPTWFSQALSPRLLPRASAAHVLVTRKQLSIRLPRCRLSVLRTTCCGRSSSSALRPLRSARACLRHRLALRCLCQAMSAPLVRRALPALALASRRQPDLRLPRVLARRSPLFALRTMCSERWSVSALMRYSSARRTLRSLLADWCRYPSTLIRLPLPASAARARASSEPWAQPRHSHRQLRAHQQ